MAATLKEAVLGLVVERPSYGYEIGQRIEQRLSAWRWKPTGVYGVLDQLVRHELIQSTGERKSSGATRAAPRTIYEATPKGVAFWREWVLESSPSAPTRQELDLKIQLAEPELLPRLIEQAWGQEQLCVGELLALTRSVPAPHPGPVSSWAEASAILQRNGEIKMLQARIEWLQEARRAMKAIVDRQSS